MTLSIADLNNLMEVTFARIDTNQNMKLEENEVRQFEMELHNQTKPG